MSLQRAVIRIPESFSKPIDSIDSEFRKGQFLHRDVPVTELVFTMN